MIASDKFIDGIVAIAPEDSPHPGGRLSFQHRDPDRCGGFLEDGWPWD